jgi:hypothetical protein
MNPFHLPAATHSYLERAAASLQEAVTSSEVTMRYACAHVAALRATAALLAARAHPATTGRRAQKNAWVLLAEVAPEFAEWAAFFAAGASKRAAAEAGSRRAVTEREADDLVRDADHFLGLVEESLGLTRHAPVEERLPLTSPWPVGESSEATGSSGAEAPGRRGRTTPTPGTTGGRPRGRSRVGARGPSGRVA